jgi:hypothetical protein
MRTRRPIGRRSKLGAEQIKVACSHLTDRLIKHDWSEATRALYKLKAVQADVEYKLHLLAEQATK